MKETSKNVVMVVFLLLVVVGMFSFHAITGNLISDNSEEIEIIIEDFKIDNSSQVNEEVDLNGTQNISRPE